MKLSSPFIRAISSENLCTWYILPLIGLNKYKFQESNFIDSYVARDGRRIAVAVKKRTRCLIVCTNKHYQEARPGDGFELLIFEIPSCWDWDIQMYIEGKYSRFSPVAKQVIYGGSGLVYERKDEKTRQITTDARLMALQKDPVLRNQWLTELTVETGVKNYPLEIPEDMELMSIPPSHSYISL